MEPIGCLTARSMPAWDRLLPWLRGERTAQRRYGAAVVTTGIALLGALVIDLPLHVHTNLLFVAAVAVSSWYGGRGAGLLASALAVLVIMSLRVGNPTASVPVPAEVAYLAVFLFVAFVVGATTEALRRARVEAEARSEELERVTIELERKMKEVQTLSEHLRESNDAERAARREAETLAQARADVLGIVAHDLRNPLNLIGSSSQVLMDPDTPSDDRRRMLEIMQRAVRRMNRLIGDLLDVTRLRAGRLTLDLADVDVRDILREAEEMCRHEAQKRHVQLAIVAPEHEQLVRADQGRVLQAMENLIGNALKFTGAGGCVTVSARAAGEEVVLSVADTGPGITLEQQAHLFDRFWQARDGDRRGVGLGLTITKEIVEAHGQHIWIESTPGSGSTFSFALSLVSR